MCPFALNLFCAANRCLKWWIWLDSMRLSLSDRNDRNEENSSCWMGLMALFKHQCVRGFGADTIVELLYIQRLYAASGQQRDYDSFSFKSVKQAENCLSGETVQRGVFTMLSHTVKSRNAQRIAGLLQQYTRGIAHAMPVEVRTSNKHSPAGREARTLSHGVCCDPGRRRMHQLNQCSQITLTHLLAGTICSFQVGSSAIAGRRKRQCCTPSNAAFSLL